MERLRDGTARLDEVSNTTETAAMQMLNGLDRTLAIIDRLEAGEGGESARRPSHDVCESLRAEVNEMYGHLQFQDIITQQIRGVGALLAEVEERIDGIAGLFEITAAIEAAGARRADGAFNPDATMLNADERQALIDEAFRTARATGGASAAPAAAG